MEIHRLQLYSTQPDRQVAFYRDTLGFPPGSDAFSVRAGATELRFAPRPASPRYHYSFLIPHGSLAEAGAFLAARHVSLLLHAGAEVIDFGTGRASYFYDADGNIAEFIERPSLDIPRRAMFSADRIVAINEIGLPVQKPLAYAQALIDAFGIRLVEPSVLRPDFCWVGDYRGVFIVTAVGRPWLPTHHTSTVNDFCIAFSTRAGSFQLSFSDNWWTKWEGITGD